MKIQEKRKMVENSEPSLIIWPTTCLTWLSIYHYEGQDLSEHPPLLPRDTRHVEWQ